MTRLYPQTSKRANRVRRCLAAAVVSATIIGVTGVVPAVASPDNPPQAVDDSSSTAAGSPRTIDVAANDTGIDTDTLSLGEYSSPEFGSDPEITRSATTASGGTVEIVNGQVRYTPTAGFTGSDTFTYWITEPEWRAEQVDLDPELEDFATSAVGQRIADHDIYDSGGYLTSTGGDWTDRFDSSQYMQTRGVRASVPNPCYAGGDAGLRATARWTLTKTNEMYNDTLVGALGADEVPPNFGASPRFDRWSGPQAPRGEGPGTHNFTFTHPDISTYADLDSQAFFLWAQNDDNTPNYRYPATSGERGDWDQSDYTSDSFEFDLTADTRTCDLNVRSATVTINVAGAADDRSTGNTPGDAVTVNVLENDSEGLDPSTVNITDPDSGEPVKSLTVPGEGVWTVGDDGTITFTPRTDSPATPHLSTTPSRTPRAIRRAPR